MFVAITNTLGRAAGTVLRSTSALSHTTPSGWNAELELAYRREPDGRTVPAVRRHLGPLRIQKGLLPEGPDLWHQIVVHPPGGVAGGDRLAIDVDVGPDAQALVTTPGATKWYRSSQDFTALQRVHLKLGPQASLEWLPMENIYFSGTSAALDFEVDIAAGARLLVFDLHCLGRPASGERFEAGSVQLRSRVRLEGALGFAEQASIGAGGLFQQSQAGLAGYPAFGTLLAFGGSLSQKSVDRIRALELPGDWAVTLLDQLLVMRWRGQHTHEGLTALREVWVNLREDVIGRPACRPRIWST